MSEMYSLARFLMCLMRAETINVVLFIGVVHQRNDDEDFVDIKFITMSNETAIDELKQIKTYAVKTLKLKRTIERENYVLYKSINESEMLEAFIIERILVMRKGII